MGLMVRYCGSLLVLSLFVVLRFMQANGQDASCSCSSTGGCIVTNVCRPRETNCLERNVALGKAASISSLYTSETEESGPACLAVNGNRGNTFIGVKQRYSPNCIHTAVPPPNAYQYWEVDLGREFIISSIKVYGREENQRNVLRNSTISVDRQLCYNFPPEEKPPVNITTSCVTQLRGQKVKIEKNTANDEFKFICLCELEVWVNCSLNGFYGDRCTECGHCKGGSVCDYKSGKCPGGCNDGWQGKRCDQACSPLTYGPDCRYECGKCKDGDPCDVRSGICPATCQPGYQSAFCNQTCTGGFYGAGCGKNCGPCWNKQTCHAVNGTCFGGCENGWQGDRCDQPCPKNTYGQQCVEVCGNCRHNSTCRHTDGACVEGCEGEYTDALCKSTEPITDDSNVLLPVVISIVVLLIIIGTAVAILALRQRRMNKRMAAANTSPPYNHIEDRNDLVEEKTFSRTITSAGNSDKTTSPKSCSGSTSDNLYYNISNIPLTRVSTSYVDFPTVVEDESDPTYGNDESVYATFISSAPKLDSGQQQLVDLLASGKLLKQFGELPKGLTDVHEAGKLPVNIKKNRYNSVLPYDKSRVILTDGFKEGNATDFINASYITGFQHAKTYIAAQGPRDNTAGDFWRMIWQEKISQIIMLTGLIENGKNKCFEYWPALNATETYGPITVTCVDIQRRSHFFIRTFAIKTSGSQSHDKRRVKHFHYLSWPDHGVPNTTSLLNFWRFAKTHGQQHPLSPILLHCTAGVGRTGTFIGLDIAYEHAVAKGEVDIYEIVQDMRKERCIMVQAPDQYVFLHKAVLEAYTGRDSLIRSEQFDVIFPQQIRADKDNTRIDKEFQTVMQMRSLAADQIAITANQEDNITKIRNKSALPADAHLVIMTTRLPGRNEFINAVFMSTHKEQRGNIVTQLPLQHTLVDFWRMVDDCDVTTIVSLGYDNEHIAVEDYCQYWPKDEGGILPAEPYVIKHTMTSSLGDSLTSYLLTLHKKESSREVQLLHYTDWAGEVPGNTSQLLQLADLLESRQMNDKTHTPVIIQCLDGVSKSGLFCVVCNVLSRLTSDKDMDVYMAVREVHNVTPQAVMSPVQYRFLYQVAQRRISEMSVYANT